MSTGSSFTLEQLQTLERAIAKGVFKVKYQDREVTYRTLNEMLKLRSVMRQCLGLSKSGGRLLVHTSKGIC